MKKENGHLPVYGVGPYYGAGIIILTLAGIILSGIDSLSKGKVTEKWLITVMIVIGIGLIIEGFFVWKSAAMGKNCIDGYIEKNELCTTGIYSIVRNPCYSGIMLICDGAVVIAHNLYLLVLPIVFWAAMTILMKHTEEKWLTELYGEQYLEYCRKVNRCIPWFRFK